MIKILALLFLTLLTQTSFATLRSAPALTTKFEKTRLTANLKPGFHFNEKAPNGLQYNDNLISPKKLDKQELVIEANEAQLNTGTAYLYVCDDAVTYCDRHAISNPKANSKVTKKTTPPKGPQKKSKGEFLLNDFEGALKLAQKSNQIELNDFVARWCPACLRLENEIFTDPEFKKLAAHFVKLKLDVDLFENAVLLEKFKIKGFPTVLFLDSQGQEILRFMDYQPLPIIQSLLGRIQKYPLSIEKIETQKLSELSADLKTELMQRYFESGQLEASLKLMQDMDPKPKEYFEALINQVDKDSPEKLVAALRSALKAEPSSARSVRWRTQLAQQAQVTPKEKEKLAEEVESLTKNFLNDPEALAQALKTDNVGEFTGFERFYIGLNFLDFTGSFEALKSKALEITVAEGQKAGISAENPGTSLRFLGVLIEAKKLPEALALVDGLLLKNKQDGDLQRRKMRILVELQDFKGAVSIGEVALKNSYGINEYYVVENLAKAYKGAGQIQKAKDLLSTYLAKNEIQFPRLAGTKKRLIDMSAELSKTQ